MELYLIKFQELLSEMDKTYNVTLVLSTVACPVSEKEVVNDDSHLTANGHGTVEQNASDDDSTFQWLSNFFTSSGQDSSTGDTNYIANCFSLFDVKFYQILPVYLMTSFLFISAVFLIFYVISFISKCFCFIFKRKTRRVDRSERNEENDVPDFFTNSNTTSDLVGNASVLCKDVKEPIFIKSHPFEINKKAKQIQTDVAIILDSTFSMLIKHLCNILIIDTEKLLLNKSPDSVSPLSSSTFSGSNGVSLQSPRVRRKWNPPQDLSPKSLPNVFANEKNLKNWMLFEKFVKRMNWTPYYNNEDIDRFQDSQQSNHDHFNVLLKFWNQNCKIKLVHWNVNSAIANYSLFLLEQMLLNVVINETKDDLIRLVQFESLGSAAEGTLIGNVFTFDVRFVFDFNAAVDIEVLHNNYSDKISPGHIVIKIDGEGRRNLKAKDSNSCLHKGHVLDEFGFYLTCNQVEKCVDGMIRKAVGRLITSHKSKMDQLPFRLNMSHTAPLELAVVHSKVFSNLGLELPKICIRFIPSLNIESPESVWLPKLYAVPSWRVDYRKSWEEKEKKQMGALSKLFPKSALSRLPSHLLWNISVNDVQTAVREIMLDNLNKQNCYESCLILLKALFSSKNGNMSFSHGINSYILSTVMDFLLIESPSCAWDMSHICDRFSDTVHFLKAAYTNVWLPNFVIHNPHLMKKITTMNKFSTLLSGRQQNLLADHDAISAKKSADFIDQRLNETGLSRLVKEDYSDDMWEYEFFLFG